MKKHLLRALLFFCGLLFLSSCLKDDPKNNETVYYGYQQIPNINEFMPQSLLSAMGNNNLYFGEEPPKIEGIYIANSISKMNVICVPGSNWIHQAAPTGGIQGSRLFNFHDQHKGISKLNYLFNNVGIPIEESDTDSTYVIMKEHLDQFIADTIAPIYFKTEQPSIDEVFHTIYIMGVAPYFTLYYYDFRHPLSYGSTDFETLYANIISGRVDKETIIENDTVNHKVDTIVKTVIKDFRWGVETMAYYKNLNQLNTLLNLNPSNYPQKGDIIIMKNDNTLHQGDFPE